MIQHRHIRFGTPLLTLLVLVAACGSKENKPATRAPSTSTSAISTTSSSTTPTTAAPTTMPTTSTTTPVTFPGLYVYPFRDLAQAQAWQRSYEDGGHQPWHLDPGITASSLAGFLGYSTAGQVMRVREDASGAHVGLGFRNPNGVPVIATTVHLVRVGSGNDAPWEVVGDEPSSALTVTTPAYGATVSSPTRVGGLITGVDESLHVQVHQLSAAPPIGDRCCIAAGGDRQPWSIDVAFAATDPVVVISVTTGGHLQAIESFAFTAVHAASATARATP